MFFSKAIFHVKNVVLLETQCVVASVAITVDFCTFIFIPLFLIVFLNFLTFSFPRVGPHLASLDLNRTLFDKSGAEEKHSGESVKPKTPGANANSISGLTGVR